MKDDERFLRDLEGSRKRVNTFAAMHAELGVTVLLPPQWTRPDATERRAYSDDSDAVLLAPIEHKVRRNLNFTSRADYPYPTVIVDEKYKADTKPAPAFAWVIENATGTHAAVVYAFTRNRWKIETHFDAHQQRECEFYVVNKNLVRFCPITDVFVTTLTPDRRNE